MNIFIVGQSFKQLWGLIVLGRKYKGKYPEAGHYRGTVKYSLPFRGQWVAVNGGVTPEVSHSWQIPTQRYAYDFVILDSTGKSCRGGDTEPSAFYCYGQDILAPADGTVMETGTGRPDSRITADRKASCAARDIRGNYILIQHAAGEYSFLAHLKPGSVLVSAGQRVKRGEKVAQCGNSGNSTEPHLHFHIQDGKSSYSSAGLPIEFDSITAVPAPGYEKFDDREIPEQYRNSYPPYLTRGQAACNAQECEPGAIPDGHPSASL